MIDDQDHTTISVNGSDPVPFELEPPPLPGEIPQRVIDELVHTRKIAADYTGAFNEAIKAQAEKYQIAPGALKRYVAALAGDKVVELANECSDIEKLLADQLAA